MSSTAQLILNKSQNPTVAPRPQRRSDPSPLLTSSHLFTRCSSQCGLPPDHLPRLTHIQLGIITLAVPSLESSSSGYMQISPPHLLQVFVQKKVSNEPFQDYPTLP